MTRRGLLLRLGVERWKGDRTPPADPVLFFPAGPAAWNITCSRLALKALAFYQQSFEFDIPALGGADDNIRFKAQGNV